MSAFDFAQASFAQALAPGLPPPAAKWTGFAKYNFIGGHNDSELLPVDALVAAANAVLRREGATLATYGLNSGPLGYRPLREFLAAKLKRTAGIACTADEILIVSGSLQALDLVNGILLARGDTVIIEQDTYQGALTRLARLGVWSAVKSRRSPARHARPRAAPRNSGRPAFAILESRASRGNPRCGARPFPR